MSNIQVQNNEVQELANKLEEKRDVLKRTVAKNSTDDEFEMFMHLSKTYGLDPFQKEIFFIKYARKGQDPKKATPTIMTSRDGYLKIADRNPAYDGLVSDVVRENDKFKRLGDGIEHTYMTGNRGKIVGAYALVYRKDRSFPIYVFAPYDEYRANTKVWSDYPSAMILKVAESMALKRAFTVSGLVSKEEMELQKEDEKTPKSPFVKPEKPKKRELTEREKEISELIDGDQDLKNEVFNALRFERVERLDELSEDIYETLVDTLKEQTGKDNVIDAEIIEDKDFAEEIAAGMEEEDANN